MSPLPAIRKRLRAFTIVELMASMVVLTLLVLLLSGAFSQVSRAWMSSSGRIEQRANARALADFIGSELQGALLPADTVSGGVSDNLRFVINPSTAEVPDEYRYADAIFWQAPVATEASFGDVAEIGYFVKWDTSNSLQPKPQLCRFFVNPSVTKTGKDGALSSAERNLAFKIYTGGWLSGEIISAVAPANRANGYRGLFGENVVGMWVRSFGLDGRELPRTFDSRPSGANQGGYVNTFRPVSSSGNTTWDERRYLPARVQISLAQLDSKYASNLLPVVGEIQTLTQSEDITDATAFAKRLQTTARPGTPLASILPGLRVYTTEVQLQNAR